ncbi:hypothetical protein [Sphingomonas abietis]|uniref:Uncharacterized protein n=1 Tax=Sphingomonas abietis TaxID=3012344 RepID=A0ABY7NUC3_9SPHN|nr:hypothetical protein [Sphingomonas abietis]WBO23061.1 hypothetical protein PBT88_02675 [Sphingomonas abietis]
MMRAPLADPDHIRKKRRIECRIYRMLGMITAMLRPRDEATRSEPMTPISLSTEPLLDHALLIAGVAVSQASTSTAVLAERIAQQPRQPLGDSLGALVELFAGCDAGAGHALHGSFHPRIAQASAGKTPSRLMKAGFTLAF